MTSKILTRLLSVAVVFTACAASARADTIGHLPGSFIHVDFGSGNDGEVFLEPGFTRMAPVPSWTPGTGRSSTSGWSTMSEEFADTGFDDGSGAVLATVWNDATNPAIQRVYTRSNDDRTAWINGDGLMPSLFRDYITIGGSNANGGVLHGDDYNGWPATDGGTTIYIDFDNLNPGIYTLRTYHNDINNSDGVMDISLNGDLLYQDFHIYGRTRNDPPHELGAYSEVTFTIDAQTPSASVGFQIHPMLGPTHEGFSVLSGFELAPVDPGGPDLPGDVTNDGVVNRLDVLAILHNYGRTGVDWTEGDLSGNFTVDLIDVGIVRRHFGDEAPPPATMAAVPEPSAWVLAIAALVAAPWFRRIAKRRTHPEFS